MFCHCVTIPRLDHIPNSNTLLCITCRKYLFLLLPNWNKNALQIFYFRWSRGVNNSFLEHCQTNAQWMSNDTASEIQASLSNHKTWIMKQLEVLTHHIVEAHMKASVYIFLVIPNPSKNKDPGQFLNVGKLLNKEREDRGSTRKFLFDHGGGRQTYFFPSDWGKWEGRQMPTLGAATGVDLEVKLSSIKLGSQIQSLE